MIVNNISYDMTVADVARDFGCGDGYTRSLIRSGVLAPAAIKMGGAYRINKELATECLADRRLGCRSMGGDVIVNGISYDMTATDVAREFGYSTNHARTLIRGGLLAPAAVKTGGAYRVNKELAIECLANPQIEAKPKGSMWVFVTPPVEASGGESCKVTT